MRTSSFKRLLGIDEKLRLVLFGLESVIGLDLDLNEIHRLFAENPLGSYALRKCERATVMALVEEYEPESVWLAIETKLIDESRFDSIVTNAEWHWFRWQKQVESRS